MESRIICTEIWRNADFRKLDHPSRNVVLFLLTNDKIPVLPVYQIPFDEISFYCNITEKKLIDLIPDLTKFGIYFIEEHFVITNKFTRAKYSGGKTEEKRKRLHTSLPSVLQDLIDIEGDIGQSLGNTLSNDWTNQPSINHKSITINHKSKTEFSEFNDLTEDVCMEIANQYSVSFEDVLDTKQDIELWMGKTSKNRYSNYKLALQTWVRNNKKSNKYQTTNRKGGYAEITDY